MESPGEKRSAATAFLAREELFGATSSLIPSLHKLPLSTIILPLPSLNWSLFRRFCNFFIILIFHFFLLLFSRLFPPYKPSSGFAMADYSSTSSSTSSYLDRPLSHILTIISFTPVSSRKYYLARSLADRLLEENLTFSKAGGLRGVNRSVLYNAFEQTIRRLEDAVRTPAEGPIDLVAGAISGGLKRIGVGAGDGGGVGGTAAEKLGAELLWLAQKMADCGAVGQAVVRWAAAERLGRAALSAETRIQVAFVRVSVFLFRHAHVMQVKLSKEGDGEEDEVAISKSQCCMSMLRTWLPLLCRTSTGVDMPVLGSSERAEMLQVLEEIIQKLDWEQQEEALALWLHHYTACPDSDWPNLESYYTTWYAQSRNLFLE